MARAHFSSHLDPVPIHRYPRGSRFSPTLEALCRFLSCNPSRKPRLLQDGVTIDPGATTSVQIGYHRRYCGGCGILQFIETRDPGSIGRFRPSRGGHRSRDSRQHPASGIRVWVGPGGSPLLTLQYPSQVIPNRPPLQNGTLGPLLNRGLDAF